VQDSRVLLTLRHKSAKATHTEQTVGEAALARRYTAYIKALEQLGLKQLDVYRYKDRDVLRVMNRYGKVLLVELPRKREEMTVEEFIDTVRKKLAELSES
jgi:vacuolar-type H+-ATPase subunit B/Vma2